MMIKLRGMVRPVRFEDSGLEPLVVGKFIADTMKRGHLSAECVVQKTGIPAEQFQAILESKQPVDKKLSKKLDRAFPKLGPILLRLQHQRDFFERYGAVRPASPLRRANLIRAARRNNRALG